MYSETPSVVNLLLWSPMANPREGKWLHSGVCEAQHYGPNSCLLELPETSSHPYSIQGRIQDSVKGGSYFIRKFWPDHTHFSVTTPILHVRIYKATVTFMGAIACVIVRMIGDSYVHMNARTTEDRVKNLLAEQQERQQ